MVDEIIIDSPMDMHVHLRQGGLLQEIVKTVTPTWATVLVMPNTDPPIISEDQVLAYKYRIMHEAGNPTDFSPKMTLYFKTNYHREFLENIKPVVLSLKLYPKNLTTNSRHGCSLDDPGIDYVLALMEELEIPLNVHPEAPGYYHDREHQFAPYLHRWAKSFPKLKIILEHLSDERSLELVQRYENVFATVTPHHLLTTGDDWFGPPFNPHLYCMPCVKRATDRIALLYAVTLGRHAHKMMAGTDSAPHTEDRKVQCGCAGVFTSPIALQLYAEAFDRVGVPHLLQRFVSDNARRIYGIEPPQKPVRLVRRPYVIPERFGSVVPMWAGKTINWSVG